MTEETKDKESTKKVPVKIIRTDNKTVLIEYLVAGKYNRSIVKTTDVKSGKVAESVIDRSIPYGVPWDEFEFSIPDVEAVANELRRNGIYTADDLRAKMNIAMMIMIKSFGATRADLSKFAGDHSKKSKS